MSRRAFTVSEEFGLYVVKSHDGAIRGSGSTLESALIKAAAQAGVSSAEDEGLQIRNTFEAAQVLESILGEKRDGTVTTGLAHA